MPNNYNNYTNYGYPQQNLYGSGYRTGVNYGYPTGIGQQGVNYGNVPNNTNNVYYCHGIEGANAFQIPPGLDKVTIWDEDLNSFYVKGYDNNGIPRVLAWNDYHPHVVDENKAPSVDTSIFATKDDIKQMIDSIDMSAFLTKKDLDKAIAELSVGERGRIVRNHESDA